MIIFRKKITIIIFFVFVLLAFIFGKSEKDIQIPNLKIEYGSKTMTSFLYAYDYDNTNQSPKTKYTEQDFAIDVQPASIISLKFDEVPHEYSVEELKSHTKVDTDNYEFSVPSSRGAYIYQVIARWYDRGTITYHFVLNVN